MAKQKKAETVNISRAGITKPVLKAQWDAMVKSKSTYGWRLSSDLKDDVLAKDKELESNQVKALEAKVIDLTKENEGLKAEKTALEAKVIDLTKEVERLNSLSKEQAELLSKHVKGTPKDDVSDKKETEAKNK